MLVKVHEAYRKIVAICDTELLGKKFEQGNLQLDVKKEFYGGSEMKEPELLELIQDAKKEDACFNIVGKHSVALATRAGLCDKHSVITIQGIPHSLSLL